MSWRTRGSYRGLSPTDQAFLDRFNQAWDTKAQGRDQTDAMEWRAQDSNQVASPDVKFTGELDANFILAMLEVASFSVPKRAAHNGWRIRITLKSGDRFMIHFASFDQASHLYMELEEFRQWFRAT